MASLFQSFRSSSMPKRLLRYALSRLELLDVDALNLDNLDLALGRLTVLEFRDVGVQLPKLEKLLDLPPAFKLLKSKVLLLRVTIPLDFYTSPIVIEVNGVEVALKVDTAERVASKSKTRSADKGSTVVPNTVDLAQSFLETEPELERRKLENALTAENQDLGASVSMSDDGNEEGPALGVGSPLALPVFLADFLQGIIDRMQVSIKSVTFQLDMEVSPEPTSVKLDPVTFRINLKEVSIEGVTNRSDASNERPVIVPKAGKRHICISDISAYLASEANVLSLGSRSPLTNSPSTTSSPSLARNPPERQVLSLSGLFPPSSDQSTLQQSFRHHVAPTLETELVGITDPLADSEVALGIPYDFSEDVQEKDVTTPRASVYHDFDNSLLEETDPDHSPGQTVVEPSDFSSQYLDAVSNSNTELGRELPFKSVNLEKSGYKSDELLAGSNMSLNTATLDKEEDLTESHVYSHEEAESMYLSAFSEHKAQQHSTTAVESAPISSNLLEDDLIKPTSEVNPRQCMPGGWDEESAWSETISSKTPEDDAITSQKPVEIQKRVTSEESTPHSYFVESSKGLEQSPVLFTKDQDGAITPKGSTRVVKRLVHVDSLSVYIPTKQPRVQVAPLPKDYTMGKESHHLGESIYPQAPGAFSVHGSQSHTPHQAAHQDGPELAANEEEAIEVEISPINVNFDGPIAFLLFSALTGILSAFNGKEASINTQAPVQQSGHPRKTPAMSLKVEAISMNFLNQLSGVADTFEHSQGTGSFSLDSDVLLSIFMENLQISQSQEAFAVKGQPEKSQTTVTKVDLQKFRFGYPDANIVSFDGGRPMSTSVRDTFLSGGTDVGLKILQTSQGARTEIETLPLVIQIDLQRLDETFSWFGGLSSFLNMSSSAVATSSPSSKARQVTSSKPRSVRFDTPIDPEDKSAASKNKLNMRIGGAFVELLGRECSIAAETNAIKLISRDEGIGVSCSLVRISGPYLKHSTAEPAISADINNIRLDFLAAPKQTDLEKLLELIIPSKVKYDHTTDEIMVDTLLRQRRQGSVLRVTVDGFYFRLKNMAQLSVLPNLGNELAKLSTVAKYLPEDDRPGLLTLAKVKRLSSTLEFDNAIGSIAIEVRDLELGHISIPSLIAVLAHTVTVTRNQSEQLLGTAQASLAQQLSSRRPVFMVRMIGDEIEPVIKIKLHDLTVEYRVPVIMDLLGLKNDATPQEFEESLALSVANLGDQAQSILSQHPASPSQTPQGGKPLQVDIGFQDCMVGLNPLNLPSKLIIVFTDAHLHTTLPKGGEMRTTLDINKASLLLTDDAQQKLEDAPRESSRPRPLTFTSPHVIELFNQGFVDICYISAAKAVLNVEQNVNGEHQVNVELRDDLLVLETCADSTQTLITLANALKPPTPPSKENKYRTNVVPVRDLLASISAEAFGGSEGEYDFDQDFAGAEELAGSVSDVEYGSDEDSLRIDSQFYGAESGGEEMFDASTTSRLSQSATMEETNDGVMISGLDPTTSQASASSDDLMVHDNFFSHSPSSDENAKVWNSKRGTYDVASSDLVQRSPLKVSVRDVHVIWNLFDGYDWIRTRDVISKAVEDIEHKAIERQSRLHGQNALEEEEEDETIGDFLFNSIYIGVPANRDPRELTRAINEGLNDNATETESIATTAVTTSTDRTVRRHHGRTKRLRLNRSKHHKITFELRGVNVDLVAFPPGGETLSSIDVRVQDLDVFDHVPTSTWKKFATYDQDHGTREMGASMVHLELLTVKPLPKLAASEIVLRATVLPLRLHVDQDALDFITRFFEFKDDKAPVHASPSDVPFIQRAEVRSIPVKLDFKPKRVDYAGLRSGHTTEFMNFIILEESRLVLNRLIIHGLLGFDRLGETLNRLWTPDVRDNQLPGVLAGLAPVRPLVNIGSGFRDLVEIPIREYQKDGRVFRSVSKGAIAFARNTGTELVKLGTKLAVGTQYALQGAEGMLNDRSRSEGGWDDDELDEEDKKLVSLYADQPTGVIQGLRGGYRSLARDVNLARDAIIAVPGEVMASQSAAGAAKAVLKRAPTIIFRPAVGVSKAVGQTLMGVTNTIDPQNRRRIGEKYKH